MLMPAFRQLIGPVVVAIACAIHPLAQAQSAASYPNHPIHFIVPYAPAGNADIVARLLGRMLAATLKQQFVIDNRGGANGNIGAELAARAPADGYTIMLGTNTHVNNVTMYANPGYDLEKDFAPVSLVSSAGAVMVVAPALPVTSMKDFIALARANRGRLLYGSGGSGSSGHLLAELFIMAAGIELTHVPYKGVAQALTDLAGGQVQVQFASTSSALPFMQSGRLRALAITTPARSALVPNVPTVSEAGLPGFDGSLWQCILVPAHTPKDIILKLNREIVSVLTTSEARDQFLNQGVDAMTSTPEELGKYMHSEIIKWAKVIRISGARAD